MMKENLVNFIAIEGVDGVGKSTIFNNLKGIYPNLEFYHDPDSIDPIGEFILSMSRDKIMNLPMDVKALLYSSSAIDRQRYIQSDIVCSDRSAISTYAYYYDLGIDFLEMIHKNYIFPKHIIYIYVDIDNIIERLNKRENEFINKIEIEKLLNNYDIVLDFFEKKKNIKVTKINNINLAKTLISVCKQIEGLK